MVSSTPSFSYSPATWFIRPRHQCSPPQNTWRMNSHLFLLPLLLKLLAIFPSVRCFFPFSLVQGISSQFPVMSVYAPLTRPLEKTVLMSEALFSFPSSPFYILPLLCFCPFFPHSNLPPRISPVIFLSLQSIP